jgi:hypothetical protein
VADSHPLDPTFLLRAQLINFDPANPANPANCPGGPVGYVAAGISNITVAIQ